MPIFQDSNGQAIKFFIQKDLPDAIQLELTEAIGLLGGRVETKIPRAGYVLIQRNTPEAERLQTCWATPDRPDRHFVPYTYVEACRLAGQELKQIFVQNRTPIKICIHPSISAAGVRNALSDRILHSGGDPTSNEYNALVIIADPNSEIFKHLVNEYESVPDKHIESIIWAKKCVEKNALSFTPVVYKNPGGRRTGDDRTPYTPTDDEYLCQWIAAKIPYKDIGGRTGNKLYIQLVAKEHEPGYGWVKRHTWQSWRERYKKNAERLDKRITAIVEDTQPGHGEKGQHNFVRLTDPVLVPRRTKKKKETASVDDDVEVATVTPTFDPQITFHIPVPLTLQGAMPPPHSHSGLGLLQGMAPYQIGSPSMLPQPEELEEGGGSPDWTVRVGHDPPPVWAKRKADNDLGEDQEARKRARETNGLTHLDIDHALFLIGRDTRFTIDEVREFYATCLDLDRTRTRFHRMREHLLQFLAREDALS